MNHLGFQLRNIYFNRQTGELVAVYGKIDKRLFFDKGNLIFAKTNQPGERLGEILFKLGKISEETFLKIETYIHPQENIGRILLRRGLISERNLQEGLVYQMKEITLNLFNVFDALFTFNEKKAISSPVGQDIPISTPQLIEDGIRLMKIIPSLVSWLENKVPFPKSKAFLDVLTEEEKELLAQISGKGSAKALAKATGFPADFFWRSLYLFYCLDLVDFQGEAEKWGEGEEKKDAEAQLALNEVLEFQSRLAGLNYYEMLGIERSAGEDEVKKAYFHLARRFHPDRFDRDLPFLYREKINEIFDQITKAYKTLINPETRRTYDISTFELSPEERSPSKRAETRFRQGRSLYNQGRFEEAVIVLEECVRLNRNKADYLLLLAMAESKIPALRKKAEQDFFHAQQLEPWNAEAFVGLGLLYKEEGLLVKAAKQFHKALEIDREHKTAKQELEAIEGKKKKTPSLFSFFKKK